MSAKLVILDVHGNELPPLVLPPAARGLLNLPSIRVKNLGDSSPTTVRLTVANKDWSWLTGTNRNGQECVTEKWLEAREGADPFTPIGGNPMIAGNYLEISSPPPGGFTQIDLRANIPADAETAGSFGFILVSAWRDE